MASQECNVPEFGMIPDTDGNAVTEFARQQLEPARRCGLDTWGLVIYRCTYTSDEAWQRLLDVLNARALSSLSFYGHPELYDSLSWTIVSDRQTLEGASKDAVRERFRAWVDAELAERYPRIDPSWQLTLSANQRFRFCIHVDEASLNSIVDDAPQPPDPDLDGIGFVNLVRKDYDEEAARDDGEDETEFEGKTVLDLGWMRVAVDGFAPRMYSSLYDDPDVFGENYVRPPNVAIP